MYRKRKRIIAWLQIAVLTTAAVLPGLPAQAAYGRAGGSVQRAESAGDRTESREIFFNEDWRFFLETGNAVSAAGKDFDDSAWRLLDLPHDYSIEQDFDANSPAGANGGYLNGGVGWYRKTFTLPESMKGKRISIYFGGVYMDSTTYVNGTMIGNYPYGYSPFAYDITEQVVADGVTENVIAVKVNHQQPSSRWYSGSGIYRNVKLVITDDVHVERYGTFVTTPNLETLYGQNKAEVSIETKVENDGEKDVSVIVTSTIYDSEGNMFASPAVSQAQKIAAGSTMSYMQTVPTGKPELWSVDSPALYKVVSEVQVDGRTVDTYETTFGFRWVTMDPDEGFFLNGEYMKLNGMCMHHDQGALGAVANYRAIERQMETMKNMGANAIRVTHNPAADELLEICDRLGLMVIDEAFDCWEAGKRSKDYGRFFNQAATHPDAEEGQTWAEFDIKNMVNRGKNNPCIIMWSIGNEIVSPSVGTAQKLVRWVEEVDPTRPATQGFNNFIDGFTNTGMKAVADVTGVVGFNYGERSYDAAHSEYPGWIIMGSETSSAVRSRGYYKVDDQKKIRSCYDDGNTVGWGRSAEAAWKANRDRKFVMGEFVWTGFDYIGEPSPYHDQYPAKSSYFGAVDTAGIPKDAYYIYQSQWTKAEENPMVHLLPHWNWEDDGSIQDGEGKIKVQAYSNAAKVELFLNGECLGEKAFEQKQTSDGRNYQEAADGHIYLEWQVVYEPGELKAVAKDADGNTIAEDVIRTAGEAAQVRLTMDREVITADGQDLSYITVDITDKDGNVVPTADDNVKFQISGNGKIVGVDNGDATEVTQSYKGNERKAYSGKAMVIVQSTTDGGSFTLTANASGLRSDTAKVFTTENPEEEELLGYEDPETVYVKKGQTPELPKTVAAVYSSGKKEEKPVTWNAFDEESFGEAGLYKISGTVEGAQAPAELCVIVMDYIGIRPVHLVTAVGSIPELPETVTAVYNTGEEEKLSVSWETITADQVGEIGSFTVQGTVSTGSGEKPVVSVVRVADAVKVDGENNIAVKNGTYPIPAASYVQPNGNDPVSAINNGKVYYSAGPAGERWIPWGHNVTDEWVQLEFESPVETGKVGLHFWNNPTDTAMGTPDRVRISYSMDGSSWTETANQNISELADLKANEENIFTFDTVTAKYIRWNFHSEERLAAGVSEVCVYEKEMQLDAGTSAGLKDIKLDGESLEGFSAEKDFYTLDLEYGQQLPEITAEAEDANAVVFIVPVISTDRAAMVQVVSEDGNTKKTYTIQFHEKAPVLENVEIQLASQELTEDDVEPIQLTAKLQDGTALPGGVLEISYILADGGNAEVKDGKLYAVRAGNTTLKAKVTYQGVTVESNELKLTIAKNPVEKIITGYEQVSVVTAQGVKPALPEKVRAVFNVGLSREVNVTWDEITPAKYSTYGTFTVEGSVEGQALRPQAKVTVKGITGVQQFSSATPVGVTPKLPEKARVYYSDGTMDELAVRWNKHPQSLFWKDGSLVTVRGTVTDEKGDGNIYKTAITVRVTSDTLPGDKFTGYKNGFYWPLGIASFTNGAGSSGDTAAELNDNIISREPGDNNRWCNWAENAREEDWAGIIFGLEEVTYKFIDNLDVDFYTDYGSAVPEEYVIEYYDGEYFNTPPEDPDNVTEAHPVGAGESWKPVTGLHAPEQLSGTDTNHFTFDTVETCAIRIRMKAAAGKCLAITEMGAYEKLAVSKTEPVLTAVSVEGAALAGFNQEKTDYVYQVYGNRMPEIVAAGGNNSSVSVIYPESIGGTAQVVVRAEDGVGIKTYNIQLKASGMSLEEAVKNAEEAKKEAEAAQKRAENAKAEAEKAKTEAERAKAEAEKRNNEAGKTDEKQMISKVYLKSAKSSKKKQIKVTWKKMKNIDGYELQYSTSSKFKKAVTQVISKKKTSSTMKQLKSRKKYYIRIRAYKRSNRQMVYGAYSKTKKVKVR